MKNLLQTLSFLVILSVLVQGMTPDLKRKIDVRLQEAKSKNINLFSDKKCAGDCFGKPMSKADLEQMTEFLGVKPETGTDQKSTEDISTKKEEITVFVSNSMPKAALKGLVIEAEQIKKHKVRFVIQGMVKDSMPKTAQLVEEIGHPLEIDPKLFEVHNVTHVPAFMAKRDDQVYRLQGNVTLDFSVEKLSGTLHDANNKLGDEKK